MNENVAAVVAVSQKGPEHAMADKMLTLQEAADQLGYKDSGLREIVERTKKGKPGAQIQFFQIGTGPIKFRQEWLDDFVLSNSIEPGQIVPAKKPKRSRRTIRGTPIDLINQDWSTVA